jgi:hypothetical protein
MKESARLFMYGKTKRQSVFEMLYIYLFVETVDKV